MKPMTYEHFDHVHEARAKGRAAEGAFIRFLSLYGLRPIAAHADAYSADDCATLDLYSPGDVVFLDPAGASVLAEIKDKYPTVKGAYGLEEYRFPKLVRACGVFDRTIYAIKSTNGWIAADFEQLINKGYSARWYSFRNGRKSWELIRYWPMEMFTREFLDDLLAASPAPVRNSSPAAGAGC
jgi:hypothetical protein